MDGLEEDGAACWVEAEKESHVHSSSGDPRNATIARMVFLFIRY